MQTLALERYTAGIYMVVNNNDDNDLKLYLVGLYSILAKYGYLTCDFF